MRTARTILVLGGSELFGKLATLVLVVGSARLLGVADFGVFSYALAVGLLAAVIPAWGYDTTLVQRASAKPERLPALLAELLVMRSAVIVVVFAVIAGATEFTRRANSQDTLAGLLIIAAVLLDTQTETYRAAAAARERQSIIAVVHLIQRGITAAGALTALLLHTGLMGLAVTYLAGTATGPLAGAWLVRRQGVRPDWRVLSRSAMVDLNRGTWLIGIASLMAIMLFRLDTVMLGWFGGSRAVGIYAAAYRLLDSAVFVSWVVTRAVFPVMASNPEPGRVQRCSERGISALAAVFVPYLVLLLCRGHEILRILFGEQYARYSTPALLWLAPAPLMFGIAYLGLSAIVAAGPTARLVYATAIALAVNVVLNLILIPRYGGVAAAFTTTLSYAVDAVALILLGRARAGRPRILRPVLPATLASAALAGPLLAPLPFVFALPAAAVVYLPCWLLVAHYVDPYQVQVFRRTFSWRRAA